MICLLLLKGNNFGSSHGMSLDFSILSVQLGEWCHLFVRDRFLAARLTSFTADPFETQRGEDAG